jgi:2-haloalkanoic acid dehalogenase type II
MDLHDFDALTFDCYGTLIDWERGILDALRPWASRHALSISDEDLLVAFAELESKHETATPELLYPRILHAVFDDIAARYGPEPDLEEARVFAASIRHWPAFPDSPAALRYLRQHYRLAVISNVDQASFVHSQARLGVEFDAIITAQDVGAYKPSLQMFERAFEVLGALGVPRERILHVAQSLYHDHEPARKLGLHTVWINRRAAKPGWGATRAPGSNVTPDLILNDLGALAAAHQHA